MQYIFRFLSLDGASFDKIKVETAIFASFNIQLYRFFSPKTVFANHIFVFRIVQYCRFVLFSRLLLIFTIRAFMI